MRQINPTLMKIPFTDTTGNIWAILGGEAKCTAVHAATHFWGVVVT